MIDRIFSALLTFCLLAGGTVAIGTSLIDAPAPTPVVTLPAVTVIGTRESASGPVAQNEPALEAGQRQLQ